MPDGVIHILKGLVDGNYVVDFYETRGTGGLFKSNHSQAENGELVIALPQFTRDIAVKVKPLGVPTEDTEDFETGDFSTFDWRFYGDANWTSTPEQKNAGTYSVQAGSINNDENSTLALTLDCISGNISFYYKVSSEQNLNYLKFYVDGVEQDKWSGEQDWTQVSFPVTKGPRTFEWTYSKNGSASIGDDTAWIDDIVFPVD